MCLPTPRSRPEVGGSSLGMGRRWRQRGPGVKAHRVARWIDDQTDGSDTVRQVEGESGYDGSPQFLRLPAAGLDISHLDINHSVERVDLALGDAQRPDRHATRNDLSRLVSTQDRSELPVEELAVEFLGLREVGRGDVEPGNAPRPDIRRRSLGGLCLELT